MLEQIGCKSRWRILFTLVYVVVSGGASALDVPPTGPIQLQLKTDPTIDTRGLSYLAVELDGYDASAFVTDASSMITMLLPSPLDTGPHSLRVTAFYANGDSETLFEEPVVVRGVDGGSENAHWMHAISLNNSYRSIGHEKSDFAGQEHFTSNGGIAVLGEAGQGKTRLKVEAESLYDSNPANNASGNHVDLSHYLLEAAYNGEGHAGFIRAGDDQLQLDNLLFSSYQRRGVSAGAQGLDQSYSVHAFAFQSDPTTSPDNHLSYPSSSHERSAGAVFGWSPLENKQALLFTVGYIEGEGTSGGSGLHGIDENTVYGGDSRNLAIDSRLLNGSLYLHGEYASASFDSDGIDQGQDDETDHAWNAMAEYSQYSSQPWFFEQWALGLKAQEVGAQFWSMGNLGMAGDLHSDTIYYQASKGGLGMSVQLIRETNNVDDDAAIADQQSNMTNLDFSYTPMDINAESGIWAWLGFPSFNSYAHLARRTQSRSDALLAGYDLNNETREYSVGALFTKEHVNWSLQHTEIFLDDRSDRLLENGFTIYEPPPDSVNLLTTLMISFMPSQQVMFSPLIQWNVLEEEKTNNDFSTVNLGFDSRVEIIPRRWFFNLNYSFNRNDNKYNDGVGTDLRQLDQVLSMQTTWALFAPKGASPGLDLYLKGSYNRQQELEADTGEEGYQVLTGFTIYWDKSGN